MVSSRRRRSDQGASLVLVTFALVPLMFAVAFAFNSYALLASELEQHNNAEYTAHASLRAAYDSSLGVVRPSLMSQGVTRAELVAGSNLYLGNRQNAPVLAQGLRTGRDGEVIFGFWDLNFGKFNEGGVCNPSGIPTINAVRVTLRTRAESALAPSSKLKMFIRAFGGEAEFDSAASAIAYWDTSVSAIRFTPSLGERIGSVRGDLNGDRIVSSTDRALLDSALALSPSSPVGERVCLDINQDGRVDVLDARALQSLLSDSGYST